MLAPRHPASARSAAERGSVLIVALLLAAVIGLALASYIKLSNTSLKVSQRAFLQNSAMNLAEMGVEKALATFNRSSNGDTAAWDGWTVSGSDAKRTLTGFTPAPGATGVIKIYVRNYTSATVTSSSSSSSSSSGGSSDDHAAEDHTVDDHTDDHATDDHTTDDHTTSEPTTDDHTPSGSALVATHALDGLLQLGQSTLPHFPRSASAPVLITLRYGIRSLASFDLPTGFLALIGTESDEHSSDDHSSDHSTDDHSSDHSVDDTPSEDVDVPASSTSTTVSSSSIVIVAKAIVTPADGSGELVKVLEVVLRRRSLWGFGLVGRSWVHLNSQASVDSWNSNPSADGTTVVPYASGVRADHGTVGCVNSANGAISLNSNAEIYGSAHSGGGTVTTTSNVRIYNSTSPASPKVDPACVRTDFSFTFPAITVPAPTVTNPIAATITSTRTFPDTAAGDAANPADGKYYYTFAGGAQVDMDSNKNLTIAGNVVWLLQNHTGVNAIRTSSNADTLFSGAASTLEIYTNGNISLDSNNDINATGQPQRCQIWGTATTSQTFTLSSNVNLGAVIYAPNAAFQIDSNCTLLGSVVGDTVQMDSNSRFHYDEALGNYGGSNPFRVSSWRELRTAAERATYDAELNF